MSRNPTFVQALADATGRPVEIAPVSDATTMGAGYLAGLASGEWASFDDIAECWRPAGRTEPNPATTMPSRERWRDAVERAKGWIPDLSALDF
jgi:glycerol kinase